MIKDFMFDVPEFMKLTRKMNDNEVGIFIRLLCLQHQNGTLHPDTLNKVWPNGVPQSVLHEFDTIPTNGCLYNRLYEQKFAAREKALEAKRMAIQKRWGKVGKPLGGVRLVRTGHHWADNTKTQLLHRRAREKEALLIPNPEVQSIYDYWNSKPNFTHSVRVTKQIIVPINKVLKRHTIEEMKKAIDNYSIVISNPAMYTYEGKPHYLREFFRNGEHVPGPFLQFLDSARPLEKFKNKITLKESVAQQLRQEQLEKERQQYIENKEKNPFQQFS